jgi:hypothetical protein
MAVSVAGVTIAGVAVDAIARGASFDAAKIGLAVAIETVQSGSTIETKGRRRAEVRSRGRGAEGQRKVRPEDDREDQRQRGPEEDQRGQAEDPEADRVAAQAPHLARQPRRRATRSRTG